MHDNARLDDELAAFTDGFLAGEDVPAPAGLEELAEVVRQLNVLIAPAEQPSPVFREHLTQRLNREWTLQHQRRTRFRSNRLLQAAAVVAVVVGALLVLSYESDGKSVQGTALGSTSGIVIVIAVVVVIGAAILWFYQHRNL